MTCIAPRCNRCYVPKCEHGWKIKNPAKQGVASSISGGEAKKPMLQVMKPITATNKGAAAKFITSPARIIVLCGILPVPYTSALGGVPTGSMKAQLAVSPVNTAMVTGFSPVTDAIVITKGTSSAAQAVLLTSSDRKITNRAIAK